MRQVGFSLQPGFVIDQHRFGALGALIDADNPFLFHIQWQLPVLIRKYFTSYIIAGKTKFIEII